MFEQNKGIVKIKDGALQGKKCERNPSVRAFLGIPYADAPVGKNRLARAPARQGVGRRSGCDEIYARLPADHAAEG